MWPYTSSRGDIEQSIADAFANQVMLRPSSVAVCTASGELSYADLNSRANIVANTLIKRLGKGSEPVAMLFDQGSEAIISVLAILKAGKFYVPLDTRNPVAILSDQLEHAGARLIIASDDHIGLAQKLAILPVESERLSGLAVGSCHDPGSTASADSPAYIFFTSGSTGKPKGVIDSQRNVLHNIARYTVNLNISETDRLSLIQPPCFSGTVSSLLASLLNGATVCPYSVHTKGADGLPAWVDETGITIYHSVPALFRFLDSSDHDYATLRLVRLEGDTAMPADFALYHRICPEDCVLAIGLGATETGLSAQYLIDKTTTSVDGRIPVGYPTQDMEILIRDTNGVYLPPGESGEICIRSRYLATGYWRDPALNAESFLTDTKDSASRVYRSGDRGRLRADGCLEYLGRLTARTKVRGEWIEPAQIEQALLANGSISDAAAIVRDDEASNATLVVFIVAAQARHVDKDSIRAELTKSLPASMIPSTIQVLTSLPVTENGKVDRRALSSFELENEPRSMTPPVDDVEATVLKIWRDQLAIESLGVTDNFLELGGDSLQAISICLTIEETLGVRISANLLTIAPNVQAFAAFIRPELSEPNPSLCVPLQPYGTKPAVFYIHEHTGSVFGYLPLARRLGESHPSYGLQLAGHRHPPKFASIEAMARRYAQEIKAVQPSGPYHLAGFCFGGVVAFEIAQTLRRQGDAVGMLALMGISPFDFPNLVSPPASRMWALSTGRTNLMGKLRYHAARSFQIRGMARWHYLLGKAIRLLRRSGESANEDTSPADESDEAQELISLHTRLFEDYVARPFPGIVDVFLGKQSSAIYSDEPSSDWPGLSTQAVNVHLYDTNDWQMMKEPDVEWLADRISQHIATDPVASVDVDLR